MAFDGVRALTIGDYLRPAEGEFAGQLGPWTHAVEAVGINPESTLMKGLFVAWGTIGLLITIAFTLNKKWAWTALLMLSISALWYLVPGTLLNLFQIILLVFIRVIK